MPSAYFVAPILDGVGAVQLLARRLGPQSRMKLHHPRDMGDASTTKGRMSGLSRAKATAST
jgi:hypothetical protein